MWEYRRICGDLVLSSNHDIIADEGMSIEDIFRKVCNKHKEEIDLKQREIDDLKLAIRNIPSTILDPPKVEYEEPFYEDYGDGDSRSGAF